MRVDLREIGDLVVAPVETTVIDADKLRAMVTELRYLRAVETAADRWVKVTAGKPTGTYADDMREDVMDALRRVPK